MSQNVDGDVDIETASKTTSDTKSTASSSSTKERKNRREKVKALTKVIVRRLPPTMTEEDFLKQIDPVPEHDYFYFVSADWTLGQNATCRAYINFCQQNDIFIFKDKFDGYVFVDAKGTEYPAIVEFAPFQGLPKGKSRKKDNKVNTIEKEAHYTTFLESLQEQEVADGKPEMKMEYSFQIKDDAKITSTPLLEYLANAKQERRDDRKRKIDDRKRQRDEEKQRKKNQLAKSIPKAIEEDAKENDDGIVVRVVKSRPLDRDRDRGRKDASKQDRDKGGRGSNANDDRRRVENEKRDADRLKKQRERQERRDAKRREERERIRKEKDEKAAKGDSNPSSSTATEPKDDKEKVKKYSESRRDRRDRRAEENSDKAARPPKTEKPRNSKDSEKRSADVSRKNSGSGDDQKDRIVTNIRNKFRPSIQIYQPSRRRSDADANDVEKDKAQPSTSNDGESKQQSANVDDKKGKGDRKVSRYTERRSKAREKRAGGDVNDSKNETVTSGGAQEERVGLDTAVPKDSEE